MSFGPRVCFTTSATTDALSTIGKPTENFPSLATNKTRSRVTSLPSSALNESTSIVSPGATRYCLLPDSITAYIKFFLLGRDDLRESCSFNLSGTVELVLPISPKGTEIASKHPRGVNKPFPPNG